MTGDVRRFRVRWSTLTWVVTVGVGLIGVVVTVLLLRAAMHVAPMDGVVRVVLIVAACMPPVIFGALSLFSPQAVEVNSDAVVVRRLARDVVIPLAQIREIRRLESREAGFTWRLFGSGGFLGRFGLFYSHRLGEFWAYAGNRGDLVLLMRPTAGRW